MSEIEEEFFKCFDIEPKELEYPDNFEYYPEITAEKLLELICIYNHNVYENEKIIPSNIKTLKEDVLHWFITDFVGNDKVKHQIQQLFNEDDTHKRTMLNIITDDEY